MMFPRKNARKEEPESLQRAAGASMLDRSDAREPMPRDARGWRVEPAPGGRGAPGGPPRPPRHTRPLLILALVLLAINWLSVLAVRPSSQPRIHVPFNPYFLKQVQANEVRSIS